MYAPPPNASMAMRPLPAPCCHLIRVIGHILPEVVVARSMGHCGVVGCVTNAEQWATLGTRTTEYSVPRICTLDSFEGAVACDGLTAPQISPTSQ